jgi:hypothetical protein
MKPIFPQTPNVYAALAGDTSSLTGPRVKPKAKPNRRKAKPKKKVKPL